MNTEPPRAGADPRRGAGAQATYFWQPILFSTLCTMSEKIFLKLNLDFIVAEIRRVFGSAGVYACVCVWIELVATTVFLFCKGPILNNIWGHSDPKNICQIAESRIWFFQIFWGGPQTPAGARAFGARFGASPPTGSPFPKFLDPPLTWTAPFCPVARSKCQFNVLL